MLLATGGMFVVKQNDKIGKIALLMQNVEALTGDEIISGKICYYQGNSIYADYIPCVAPYPNIGKCVERVKAFYSQDKGQCYE